MVNKYGNRLKEALEVREMGQKDLVLLTGLSKSGISQYISGKRVPPEKAQEIIAQALDLYTTWFFEDEPVPDSSDNKYRNCNVAKTAKILGISEQSVRDTLVQGRVSWGFAIQGKTGKYHFHVSYRGLADYMKLSLEEMHEFALANKDNTEGVNLWNQTTTDMNSLPFSNDYGYTAS